MKYNYEQTPLTAASFRKKTQKITTKDAYLYTKREKLIKDYFRNS